MNTLKLKLVALVVLFFSNHAFADLPRPIYSYHHRLHRIGYEALPSSNYYGDMVLYLLFPIVFLLLCVGLIILFKRRKISLNSIFSTGKRLVSVMKRNKVFVFFVILMIFSGIFILSLLYGRRLTSKCNMDLYGVESRTVGGNRILHVYHDDGPGWYYSDAVPDLDRKIIMEKITYGLLYDLQKSIVQSGVWICEGAEEYCLEECSGRKSKNDIFLKVLKNRKDLAVRCHGIPIEWLIKRIIFPAVVPGAFDGCSPTKQVDVTEHCMGKVWDFYCNRKRTEQFKDDDVNQLIKIQDEYLSRIQEFRKEYESANVRQEKTQEKNTRYIMPELMIIVICVGFLLIIQEILLFGVIKKESMKKIRRIAIGIWITFFVVIMVALSMRLLFGECAVKDSRGEPMRAAPMPLTRPKPAFQEKAPQCKCGYRDCSCGPFVSVSHSGRCNCDPSQRFSSK